MEDSVRATAERLLDRYYEDTKHGYFDDHQEAIKFAEYILRTLQSAMTDWQDFVGKHYYTVTDPINVETRKRCSKWLKVGTKLYFMYRERMRNYWATEIPERGSTHYKQTIFKEFKCFTLTDAQIRDSCEQTDIMKEANHAV